MARQFTGRVLKTGGLIPSLYRGWKEWKKGDYLVGAFIETKMGDYNGTPTPNHLVKVIECNFKVTKKDGKEIDPVGQVFTINSAGILNKLLVDAEKGSVVAFNYEGKQRGSDPKDKTEYHTFSDVELFEGSDDYDLSLTATPTDDL